MVGLASVLAILAIFAIWADRQLLNTDEWVKTTTALLRNEHVQKQSAEYLANQVSQNVNVAGQLETALPPRLAPLAKPVAGALNEVIQRLAQRLLDSGAFQRLWADAMRLTHQQFVNLIEGKSRATIRGGAVVIDFKPMIAQLATRAGISPAFVQKLPPQAGVVTIMRADQLDHLQTYGDILRRLPIVLGLLVLALYGGAVALARGRRRTIVLACSFGFLAAGLVVLALRRIVGNHVVDVLTRQGSAKPSADAVWSIGTTLLAEIASTAIIVGLVLAFVAWLLGPQKWAVGLRRRMAPTFAERPAVAYGIVGVVFLVLVAWGPIPALQRWLPILIIALILAAAMIALQRSSRDEFLPEAGAYAAR
jgi:hypothetical protein